MVPFKPFMLDTQLIVILMSNSLLKSLISPAVAKSECVRNILGKKKGIMFTVDWGTYIDKRNVDEKKAVMIVLPGLTASAREPYVK